MSDRWAGRNGVAIVGVGHTRAFRHAEETVGSLAVKATTAAVEDAGLSLDQIDGVSCGDSLPAVATGRVTRDGFDTVNSAFLARHLGVEPTWRLDQAAFQPALVHAVDALLAGSATYVVVNRTLHNPPGRYSSFSAAEARGPSQWSAPYGQAGAVASMAVTYMEYQQRFGCTQADMATLVLQLRENVQSIPDAYWYGKDLTFDDYMSSRMIAEPMCLFDADIPVDGSGSVVLTTAERAADLPNPPVYITASAGSRVRRSAPVGTFGLLDEIYNRGQDMGRRLWSHSGWRPEDVDVVQTYDGFTPLTFLWLESLGFCGIGEAWRFIQDGKIDRDGDFPLLSGGGNQGWGRLHGFPHVLECYLQLARRAGDRQIDGATTGLASYAHPGLDGSRAVLFSGNRDA